MVSTRAQRLAHHVDLNAAQAPQVGVELKIGKHFAQMVFKGFFKVACGHASQCDNTYFG